MLNAIYFYRLSHWLYRHHIPILPKLITLLIFLIYNSKIPPQAKIGKGSKFGYGGISVVVHHDSVIGENCSIGQLVTIGGGNSKYPGVPTIGNNVRISCGSIVFGGITIEIMLLSEHIPWLISLSRTMLLLLVILVVLCVLRKVNVSIIPQT